MFSDSEYAFFFFSFLCVCDSNDASDDVFRQCLVCLDVEKVSVCGTNFVFQFND